MLSVTVDYFCLSTISYTWNLILYTLLCSTCCSFVTVYRKQTLKVAWQPPPLGDRVSVWSLPLEWAQNLWLISNYENMAKVMGCTCLYDDVTENMAIFLVEISLSLAGCKEKKGHVGEYHVASNCWWPLGGYGGLWPTSSKKLFLTALQPWETGCCQQLHVCKSVSFHTQASRWECGTGWDLWPFVAVLALGQMSPAATKYKETMRD